MSNDAAIANLISDIGPTIERADPAVARAALAHLFAAAVVRPVDADGPAALLQNPFCPHRESIERTCGRCRCVDLAGALSRRGSAVSRR